MQAPHAQTIVNVGPNARCSVCHKPIPEGSEALWDYYEGTRHLECSDAQEAPLEAPGVPEA
jgi:hypothetical protein